MDGNNSKSTPAQNPGTLSEIFMSIKIIKIFFLFSVLFHSGVVGQTNISLKRKLLNADSVVLISYDNPAGYGDRKDVIGGIMNLKLLKEYKTIKDSNLKKLITIITAPFRDSIIDQAGCFEPHHTIYIFKKNTISFISICFLCNEIYKSEDIDIPDYDFDKITWKRLELFFKKQGFKYGFSTNTQ